MDNLLRTAFRLPPSASAFCLPLLICLVFYGGCIFQRGQRYSHFATPTPLPQGQILILGFMGGREPWNNDDRNVRKLALKLRSMNDPEICVETVENKKRPLAIELINKAFDRNGDGKLDDRERATPSCSIQQTLSLIARPGRGIT